MCAGHGTCNGATGVCACERGFKGDTCDDTTDNDDRHVYTYDGPFFTGTVLKVVADRNPNKEFTVFKAQIGNMDVTTIRGDG